MEAELGAGTRFFSSNPLKSLPTFHLILPLFGYSRVDVSEYSTTLSILEPPVALPRCRRYAKESMTEKSPSMVADKGQARPTELGPSQPDRAPLERIGDTQTSTKKPWSFYLSFLGLNVMVFIVCLDATTLAFAIPVQTLLWRLPTATEPDSQIMSRELHGTTLEAFWANISFLLMMVVTQPLHTSFSDVLGRPIPLHFSFLIFAIGSIVFAVAKNMSIVIIGRTLQGVGAGGLDVLGEIIVADMTTMKERPLYLGLLSIPMAAGSVLGPPIGALFTEDVTWRWFVFTIREQRIIDRLSQDWVDQSASNCYRFPSHICFLHLKPIDQSMRVKLGRVDWLGMTLFTIGTTSFVLPLSWASVLYPWDSWRTLVPLIIGVAVLVFLGIYESKPSNPMFPYRIFHSATAIAALFGSFVHGMVVYCLLFYMPLFFQSVRLQKPLKSVVFILPLSITVVVFSLLSAICVDHFRKYRWNIRFGWIFMSCGVGLLSLLNQSSSLSKLVCFQILTGIGIGGLYCIMVIPIQASVRDINDAGLGIGIFVSFRLFGAVVGLAICSAIFNGSFEGKVNSAGPLPVEISALKKGSEAISFIPTLPTLHLPPEILRLVLKAYSSSIRDILLAMAGISVSGSVMSLLTREIEIDSEDVGRQRFDRE